MSILVAETSAMIDQVRVHDTTLEVVLTDGRALLVPLAWFPRLLHGTVQERANWRLIGDGTGVHWPELDEDISLEALLKGQPSMESPQSLKRWLSGRAQ